MPPIEVGAPRPIGAVSAEIARRAADQTTIATSAKAGPANPAPVAAKTAEPLVATSGATDPGEAPVNTDRVAEIRKALETGNYPLVPARIADAMIAAGMFLRTSQA